MIVGRANRHTQRKPEPHIPERRTEGDSQSDPDTNALAFRRY